jgi:Endonuclease/Exonuclease/phosphatase family
MGSMQLKLASWNIGGGVVGKSHQRDRSPSLGYYASILEKHLPDVVCLQEAHDYHGRQEGQPEYLAGRLGYPYVASFPLSGSHLAEGASLALAVLSRFPINTVAYKQFPNPGLQAIGPGGDPWNLHDKGYVVGMLDLGDRMLGFVNGHCFPLHCFGASPVEPRFEEMWNMLTSDLLAMSAGGPAFAAIDLNYEPIQDLLIKVLGPGEYINAFEGTPTTAKGAQQDYILYESMMRLLTTTVTATSSDHSYCQIEILL